METKIREAESQCLERRLGPGLSLTTGGKLCAIPFLGTGVGLLKIPPRRTLLKVSLTTSVGEVFEETGA